MIGRAILRLALLAGATAAGGCHFADMPAAATDINARLIEPASVRELHRVVFVELGDETGHPGVAEGTTQALFKSIQAQRLFHLDVVRRDDPVCRDVILNKREAFRLEDLMAIREELRCDAVLFGKISNFMSYPRMQMGLYLRLLDLRNGRLLWAADHIWDMTDKDVERRAEAFYSRNLRQLYGPAGSSVLLMSPAAFERFVAEEIAQTFVAPPEETEELARKRRRDEYSYRAGKNFKKFFEDY